MISENTATMIVSTLCKWADRNKVKRDLLIDLLDKMSTVKGNKSFTDSLVLITDSLRAVRLPVFVVSCYEAKDAADPVDLRRLYWRATPLSRKIPTRIRYWTSKIELAMKTSSEDEALRIAAHGAAEKCPTGYTEPMEEQIV